jgi:hypothetical protein
LSDVVSTVLPALAVVGVMVGSMVAGVCMAACASSHWPSVSKRARRFFRPEAQVSESVRPIES